MKKVHYLLAFLLFAVGINNVKADDTYTLALGNYDDLLNGDWDEDQCYNDSYFSVSPTTFYLKHTGSQIIYTKDQLADMAGKEITGVSFLYYNQSAFSAFPRTVKVWVQEVDDDAFTYSSEKKAYQFFEYADGSQAVKSYSFEDDFVDYYCLNGEMTLTFDTPFAYSGTKNLVVTVSFDGDDTSDSNTDIEWYYNTDASKKALTFCSDNNTFGDYHDSEDWPLAKSNASSASFSTPISQPLTKFTYQEGAAPAPQPATLTGNVTCGDNAVADATVTLTSGKTVYTTTTTAEGSYTLSVEESTKNYALTVTADDYEDYAATDSVSFTSGETKTLNVNLTKKDKPSVLSGVVTCEGNAVADATVSLTCDTLTYSTTTDAEGQYSLNVVKSENKYRLTVTATDCNPYTAADSVAFVPGEDQTLDIQLTLKDKLSLLKGYVTSDGEAVKNAVVKLTYDADLCYETKTKTDGSYTLYVQKSRKPYAMTVTAYGFEDYAAADSVVFTPGEDKTLNVSLDLLPDEEGILSLGRYDVCLHEGDTDDCYDGSFYDYSPTTFYLKHTGSQIIYTKDQLAAMAEKGIYGIRFAAFNQSAYDTYARNVNIWVSEVDDDAFAYNADKECYDFFDYDKAVQVVTDYAFDGDVSDYLYEGGELSFTFDKPVNYSGKKNLLVTITFDGDATSGSLDYLFFRNKATKNKAMTFTNDYYSFADFGETEDWPHSDSNTGTYLEQPVTRFVYGEPTAIQTVNNTKGLNDDATYNLAGQRVSADYKGIVIQNGKKQVRK